MTPRLILVFFFTLAVSITTVVVIPDVNPANAQSSKTPSAPTGFTARAAFEDGRHKILLSWDEHPANERITGWQWKRWDTETGDDIGDIRLANRDHTFTSFVDLNVRPGTAYTYTVNAINANGPGEYSEYVTVTTLGSPDDAEYRLPAKPTGLTAENIGYGVLLEWDDPSDPSITGYQIWRRVVRFAHGTAESTPIALDLDLTGSSTGLNLIDDQYGRTENRFFDSDRLEPKARYVYLVRAMYRGLRGPVSDELQVMMPDRLPVPPAKLPGISARYAGGQIEITWDRIQDPSVTDIFIERTVPGRVEAGHSIHIGSDAQPAANYTSFDDGTNLEPNTTYFYTVQSRNQSGTGPKSEPISVTTPALILPVPTVRPATPRNVKAETIFADGHHRVIVTWNRPKTHDQVTDWRIEKLDPRSGKELDIVTLPNQYPTLRTYHDIDVEPFTTYSYTVSAVNPKGWSDVSRRVTVTTGREAEDTTTKPISIEEWFETRPPETGGVAPTSAAWLLVAIVGAAAVVAGFALRRVPMAISILRHKQRR